MKKNLLSLAVIAVLTMGCTQIQKQDSYTRPKVSTPIEALALLKTGNERFINNKNLDQDLSKEKKDLLSKGQAPFVTLLSCSDSRVVSPYIFDQGLGDIFEVKLAGNIVDDLALGSIEYGIVNLKTPLIVILAHESCGAVHATMDVVNGKLNLDKDSHVHSIVEKIAPSVNKLNQNHNLSDLELKELLSVENARAMKTVILSNKEINTRYKNKQVDIVIAKYMLDGSIVWE
ncbi:MAG: carbonic anhydrase [Cetobacterium sp.]